MNVAVLQTKSRMASRLKKKPIFARLRRVKSRVMAIARENTASAAAILASFEKNKKPVHIDEQEVEEKVLDTIIIMMRPHDP